MPVAAISSTPGPAAGVALFALVAFGAYGVALSAIDIATHRLPNALVLPGYGAGIALCAMASALAADAGMLVRAVAGMAVLFVAYLALRFAQPGGMGGGDVKLAGVIGLALGWAGWGALATGAAAAFLLGGVVGLALLAGGHRRVRVPFGPFMLAGAWVGILYGDAIMGALLPGV